ncbi:MAG TPA: di-heme enzyme, partial [bacterium]|nr:di-heme enzyme [bacterium]
MKHALRIGLVLLGLCSATAPAQAAAPAPTSSAPASDTPWQWNLPAHVPEPRVPNDNPMSEARFQLGRRVFYDPRLSGNQTQSCASCHLQRLAFTDGRALSLGSTGEETARNAPSIANAAYHPTLTWANYTLTTLE